MKIILVMILSITVYANDIVGIWNLSNNERPFTCCSLVGSSVLFEFKNDGTMYIIEDSKTMTGSTRHYELKDNKITFFLQNSGAGTFQNFIMKKSSATKTFRLEPISNNCYHAVDSKYPSNEFTMCKQ